VIFKDVWPVNGQIIITVSNSLAGYPGSICAFQLIQVPELVTLQVNYNAIPSWGCGAVSGQCGLLGTSNDVWNNIKPNTTSTALVDSLGQTTGLTSVTTFCLVVLLSEGCSGCLVAGGSESAGEV
jgi:hypothetical protein